MPHIKVKSKWNGMEVNTQTNQCFSPYRDGRKRMVNADPKPSANLEELSMIYEEASKLSATDKPVPGGHRNLAQLATAQQKAFNKKRGIKPFWNRSPSLQQWKKVTESNSKYSTCSGSSETSSASPSLLPSLDSELPVDSSSPASMDSCSSIELFREADDRTCVQQDGIGWSWYKNSTLLDSSKAANIDVVPQPSNLSDILEHSGNNTKERNFKNHVTDGTEVYGTFQPISVTATDIEQKRMYAISISSKKKNIKQKHQDEVPICSIILAPVCCQPAKVWQYEQLQSCTTFEDAPLDIIITSPT